MSTGFELIAFANISTPISPHSSTALSQVSQFADPITTPGYFHASMPSFSKPPKRLILTLEWVDQKWGNRKGEFTIRLIRESKEIASWVPFGVASHEWEKKTAEIQDHEILTKFKAGDSLEIWKIVGGGGGHSLTVKNFTILMEME